MLVPLSGVSLLPYAIGGDGDFFSLRFFFLLTLSHSFKKFQLCHWLKIHP